MTTTLAVDDNNDIFIGADGNLSRVSDLQAVLQAAQQAAQAQRGEMIYAVDEGVPNFSTIWNGSPNLAQFRAALLRTLRTVPGVVSVRALEVSTAAGVLSYAATIETEFGSGALNG